MQRNDLSAADSRVLAHFAWLQPFSRLHAILEHLSDNPDSQQLAA